MSNCYSNNGVIHTISAPLYPQSIDPTIPASAKSAFESGITCGGTSLGFNYFLDQLGLTTSPTFKTLFAFSDEAINALAADFNSLNTLTVFLTHALDVQTPSDIINTSNTHFIPKAGPYLRYNYDSNNNLIIGGQAKVICPDIWTRDGIIHVIDRPVLPLTAENNLTLGAYLAATPGFTLLSTYLPIVLPSTINLMDTKISNQYTIFAPTDDAFAKLPTAIFDNMQSNQELLFQILAHHISPTVLFPLLYPTPTVVPSALPANGITVASSMGGIFNLTINNAVNVGPFSQRRNGLHYTTNTVLMPPSVITSAVVTQMSTIPSLSIFVAWIKSFPVTSPVTLFLSTSLNPNKFTLFAPRNSAFADMGLNESTVTALNDAAGQALFFRHMVAKDLPAAQLVNDLIVQSFVEGQTYTSSSGSQWLRFNQAAASPNDWFINGIAKITVPDAGMVMGCYIHIVDAVLPIITPQQNTTVGHSLESPGNSEGFPTTFKSKIGGVNLGTNQLDNATLGSTPFTIFTFDNTTYATEFTNKTQMALDASAPMFQALIRNHIINSTYFSSTINTATIKTMAGNSYVVRVLPGGVLSFDNGRINATVKTGDVIRRNGVAHVLDKVLWPADVKAYVSTYGDPTPTPTSTSTPGSTPTPTPYDPNATPTPTPTNGVPTPTPTSSAPDYVAVPALILSVLFLGVHAFF